MCYNLQKARRKFVVSNKLMHCCLTYLLPTFITFVLLTNHEFLYCATTAKVLYKAIKAKFTLFFCTKCRLSQFEMRFQ